MKANLKTDLLKILLIEDRPGDANLLKQIIKNSKGQSFKTEWVDCLKNALEQLKQNTYDVILLDLKLPDSTGLNTLTRIHKETSRIPIVVLTGLNDDQMALEAIKQGAQDYLPKDQLNEKMLSRVIRYAIERNRIKISSQESDEKFRTLFQQSNDGIIIHDPQGNILDVNQKALSILGYEKSEMLRMKTGDLHPDYAVKISGPKTRQLTTKGYALFEIDFIHKKGHIINAEVSASSFDLGKDKFFQKIIRDITERKKAEQKLLMQDTALKSAANGIVITDKNGTILWVNTAFTRLTGFTYKEAVGQNPRILKSAQQNESFYKALWETISSGNVWHGELINSKKDGTLYFEEQTITPVKNDSGEITHFIGIKSDITKRKQADEYFKLFRMLIDRSNDAIEVLDPKTGQFLDVNEKACISLGYSREELLSLTVFDIDPMVSKSQFKRAEESIRKAGGMIWEGIHKRKDGSIFPVEVNIKDVLLDRPYRIAIVRDITDRRKTEDAIREQQQKFQTIIEHSNELFYIHNTEDELIYVSPQSKSILGYTPEEMMVKWTTLITSNPINEEGIRITKKAINTGERQPPYLLELKNKNGEFRLVEVDESPVKNEKGKVVEISGALRDVTEKRRAEFALKESEDKFRSLSEQSPNMIFINQKGRIVYANKKSTDVLGYKDEELYSPDFNFYDLIAPESLDIVRNSFQKHLQGKEIEPYEYGLITKSGDRIDAINSTKLIDYLGQPAILGIVTDITEQKKQKVSLLERERYLQALNKASQTLLSSPDIPYQEFVNIIGPVSKASRIYIFNNHKNQNGELLGSQIAEWCNDGMEPQINNPELQNVPYSAMSWWEKTLKNCTVINEKVANLPKTEKEFLTAQGIKSILVLPLFVDNDFVGFIGFDNCVSDRVWEPVEQEFLAIAASDLTNAIKRKSAENNLKESEDRFRTAFENGPMGIALIGTDKKYIKVNKTLCGLFGYSEEEFKNMTFLDITHPDDYERDKKAAEDLFSGEIDVFKAEKRYVRKNKQFLWANIQVSVIKDGNNKVKYVIVMIEDISERKKAEENLKLFRALIDKSNDAVMIINPETNRFLDVNEKTCSNLGYSRDELLSMTFFDIDPTANKPSLNTIKKEMEKSGSIVIEGLHMRKDGSTFPVEVNITMVQLNKAYIMTISRDITERKRAEKVLQESEKRFRNIFEQAAVGIVYSSMDGVFLKVNQRFCDIIGYNHQQLLKMNFAEITHPDDLEADLANVRKLLGRETSNYKIEKRYIRKDNSIIWVKLTVSLVFNSDNEPEYFIGVVEDITDRKKIEDEIHWLARIPQENPTPVLRISKDGLILYANKASASLLEEWQCAINQTLPDAWREFITEVFESGQVTTAKIPLTNNLLSLAFAPIPEEDYVNVYGIDITDLKRTEALLRKRTHDLGERVKEMTCLYGVNHLLDNSSLTLDQKIQKIVEIIPLGWQYPKETCAGIIYHGKKYETNNFQKTQWGQTADIIINGEKAGMLEVFYLEEKPQRDVGPFLREEEDLIKTIAKNIEEHIEYEFAVNELRNSEERLKALFEFAPDAIYLNDLKGNFVDANLAAERLTGFEKEELIGKNMLESNLLSATNIPKAAKLLAKSVMGKPTGPGEFILNRKNGTEVVVEISTFPIKIHDKRLVLGIARDITDRYKAEKAIRESEEKYRAIFEESKDAIYVSTVDGKFVDINPAGIKLFGYDSLKEMMSVNIKKAIYSDPLDRQKFQEALNKNGVVVDYEIKLRKKDGEKLIVLVTASVVSNENNNIIGYRGIIRDITKQKELERQLLQAQKMEAIGTLAGGIAHDFNNILSAILGYTELTKDIITDNSMVSRNLDQVYKAGLRAKDLIQQILTFSRQTDHKPQPLQIELIVKEALKLIRASLPATIEIRQSLDSKGGYTLADPTQIHQVIMNLCTNAYDAMRNKGGLLEVNLRKICINGNRIIDNPDVPNGDYLKMSIRDTGIGMDPETAKRIFDPFFTTKKAGAGTGLGLSVVHGIVKKHCGEITVQSEPGKGTTFNVYLPEFKSRSEKPPDMLQEFFKGKENILYVDDEEPIVQTGVQILGKLGYQVTGKTQSLEALETFKQSPEVFDLVISDLSMPNMTGLELSKRILEIRPDIPIILITGYNENVTKDMAKKMGIRDLIMKPILTADLSKIIRQILNQNTVGS